jgi:uncharacterized protein
MWILRILALLLLVRLVARFVWGIVRGYRGGMPRRPQPPSSLTSVPLVRDSVCNTFIPRERALRAVIDGQEQFFCSPECRERARRAS